MVDRHGGPPARPPPGGISKSSSRSVVASSASSSVRRNLFQSQLTRRPTSGTGSSGTGSSSTSTTGGTAGSGSAETLRLDAAETLQLQLQPPGEPSGSSSSGASAYLDIVIRDKNGEIELGDPPTPVMEDRDEGVVDVRLESEKERQRLAEAVKQHQIDKNSVPVQPEELLEAVRASLRAKVAALAEDNWIFEREELPRHQ